MDSSCCSTSMPKRKPRVKMLRQVLAVSAATLPPAALSQDAFVGPHTMRIRPNNLHHSRREYPQVVTVSPGIDAGTTSRAYASSLLACCPCAHRHPRCPFLVRVQETRKHVGMGAELTKWLLLLMMVLSRSVATRVKKPSAQVCLLAFGGIIVNSEAAACWRLAVVVVVR